VILRSHKPMAIGEVKEDSLVADQHHELHQACFLVLGTATRDEYLAQGYERCGPDGYHLITVSLANKPDARFYRVSMD